MAGSSKSKHRHKINWQVWIPVILWIGCVLFGILKILLGPIYNSDASIKMIDILNSFNSNTFSTFLSVVACMLYQYFSSEKDGKPREEISGLSMRRIPVTIIVTLLYIVVATFDVAISHLVMTIIYLVVNIGYVICFFGLFLARKGK